MDALLREGARVLVCKCAWVWDLHRLIYIDLLPFRAVTSNMDVDIDVTDRKCFVLTSYWVISVSQGDFDICSSQRDFRDTVSAGNGCGRPELQFDLFV